MKLMKLFALLCILCAVMLTSCNDENIDSTVTIEPDPQTEQVDVNPLVGRSVSSADGLDLDCVTVLYPFDLVDNTGGTYTVIDESSFLSFLTDSSLIIVDFFYPLDILDGNGAEISLADNVGLADAFSSCLPTGGWDEELFPAYDISDENSCYELVYPMSLTSADGNILVVNDAAEFDAAIASQLYFFTFPLDLLDEDGMTVTVADVDGLFNALFSCGGWEPDSLDLDWQTGFEYIGCYTVDFPMNIVLVDGSTITVNNHMELCDYMLRGEMVDYGYPLTLIAEDGTVVIVNDQAELTTALEDCDYGPGAGLAEILWLGTQPFFGDSITCYSITFPISFSDEVGTVITVSDQGGYDALVNSGQLTAFSPIFPFELTYANGNTEVINDEGALFVALSECE